MKKKLIIFSVIAAISLLIFIILALILNNNDINTPTQFDISIRDFFYNIRGEKGGFLYWTSKIITELGNTYFIIILAVVLIIITKLDNRFISYVIGALLMILTNLALKDIFQRERPTEALNWAIDNEFSFPSGHSAACGFTYMFLAYFIYDSNYNKKIKITIYSLCGILFILVPTTRLIFGAHYFTDVIAGILNGVLIASISIILMIIFKEFKIFDEPLFSLLYKSIKNKKEENKADMKESKGEEKTEQ